MKAKQIWANLAVEDVERTRAFYTVLGFKPNSGHSSNELASFLFGENDFVIHFFLKERLKSAWSGEFADLKKANEVMFSLSAASKEEVNTWASAAKQAGGKIFREPSEDENGYYYCGFADPDGHRFNVLLIGKGM